MSQYKKISSNVFASTLSTLAFSIAAIPSTSEAGCSVNGFCGKIFYLGKTADKKHAVFLSAIKTPGKYDVSTTAASAPGGGGDLPVDTWYKDRRNLRLTVSPYPEDWGGTHILYNYPGENSQLNSRHFVASVNQTPDGIVFPPDFKPPVIQPPVRPPVTGVTPELPMGVKPPIGVLPPSPPVIGVMPELPMGVKPPVGVLPPSPPVVGVMPELPMGVKPPIGVLPPSPPVIGVMPELPMGVKPPIGVLPPSPPVIGVMPELPMGVKPPVGVLPPNPPVTGVTPELPTVAAKEGRVDLPATGQAKVIQPCVMQQDTDIATPSDIDRSVNCVGVQLQATLDNDQSSAPLTDGREFGLDTEWNVWADSRYTDIKDERNDLDLRGQSGSVSVGLDRRLDSGLIAGLMLGANRSTSEVFDGAMRVESNGFTVGPYVAYPVSANWVLDGALLFGQSNNSQRLLVLNGDFVTNSYSVSANANGQYALGEAFVRPRVGISYSHNRTESYDLKGRLGQLDLVLENAKNQFNIGSLDSAIEVTRVYRTDQGTPIMPFGELSLSYAFARANDGKVMTGDLSTVETSPWVGGAKIGVRSMLSRSTTFETSAAYLSLGQGGLSVWELRLFFGHAF